MAGIFGITNKGRYLEDFQETFYLASGITAADVGKAVSIDTSAAHTVKLAAANDQVVGRLEVVEDRKQEGILVGTISLKGFARFPIAGSLTGVNVVAVGDSIEGAGNGEIRAANDGSAKTPDHRSNFVKSLFTEGGVNYALVAYL